MKAAEDLVFNISNGKCYPKYMGNVIFMYRCYRYSVIWLIPYAELLQKNLVVLIIINCTLEDHACLYKRVREGEFLFSLLHVAVWPSHSSCLDANSDLDFSKQ